MIQIDIDKATLVQSLEGRVTVLKRNNTAEINPMIKEIREKDILRIQTAIQSITEKAANK